MRVYVGIALATLTLGAVFIPAEPIVASGRADGLEVHEWGTFTSMQGVDGLSLEGLHHEEEALPEFVHRVVETPVSSKRFTKAGMRATRVSEKMETPVIYFYADRKTNVRVDVSYSRGIMSEWYPAATHDLSTENTGAIEGVGVLDVSRIRRSSLRWDIEVTPRTLKGPANIPSVDAEDPWAFARETKAAYVTDKATGQSEHYLFYRGLGQRALPVFVTQREGGNVVIKNETGKRIPAAFVLESNTDGARWLAVGTINKKAKADIGEVAHRPNKIVAAELRDAVEDALVDTGLFRDEAAAMVKTWSRSWFESEGSRVIYLVPREVTDNMLPLSISPTPTKLVRTLVGRLEYVRPQVAKEVEGAVRDSFSSSRQKRVRAKKRLARLGRYLEPHLRLVLASSTHRVSRANAEKLLAQLK